MGIVELWCPDRDKIAGPPSCIEGVCVTVTAESAVQYSLTNSSQCVKQHFDKNLVAISHLDCRFCVRRLVPDGSYCYTSEVVNQLPRTSVAESLYSL